MVTGLSSFSCFWLILNDSVALKIVSSNCSIAFFRFINSEFQKISYGYASIGALKWFSSFFFTPRHAYNALREQIIAICNLVSVGTFIVADKWCILFSVVCSGTIRVLYHVNVLFFNVIYLSFWLCWSNTCITGVATKNIFPIFIKWGAP